MSVQTNNQAPLNDVQVMLLRLFSREMTAEELQTVQNMLLDYYNRELQDELEGVIRAKNISTKDFEDQLNKQQRTL
ncbi:MAG: hypothetical protein ACKV1O_24310 [Saprospiraceae bacterium]